MALSVKGLVNIQFAIQRGKLYVLEVNPRASRTVPFVSKAIGVPMARAAALLAAGRSLASLNLPPERDPVDFFIKAPVFPFKKFPGEDMLLGPEMKSTGEVMGDLAALRRRVRQGVRGGRNAAARFGPGVSDGQSV